MKTHPTHFGLLGAVCALLLAGACRKDLPTSDPAPDLPREEQVEGLGDKLENPYSVKNMQQAVQLLMSVDPDASHPDPDALQPTHYYVRFLPQDTIDLALLDSDTVMNLSTVPYGYQNSMDLDYYHDPAIPEGEPTWLYGIAPVDYELPAVRHEILEDAYIPEDDEDELDVLALKLSGNLQEETIDGRELMSADLTDRELLGIFSRRYHPSGRVYVDVTNSSGDRTGEEAPVKNAAILVRTWWWSDVVHTNDDGYYWVPRRYKDRTAIRLANKNRLCHITKTWTEHIGLWITDWIGEGKANTHTVIRRNREAAWYKATVNNAFQDYDKFARENGIPRPWNVRTFLLSGQEASSAPMLNRRPLTVYNFYYPFIANLAGQEDRSNVSLSTTFIVDVLALITGQIHNYPDITIGMKGNLSTNSIRSAVIHELAHYSHRKQIGSFYWANVQYQAMYDPTNNNGAYGDGTATYAKYTAVAEAWSHFVEYDQMQKQHDVASRDMTAYAVGSDNITRAYKVGRAGGAKWIPSGLFRDLMDTTENTVELYDANGWFILEGKDKVSGFTYEQLFELLTDEVRSIPRLRDKIIGLYPNKNQNNEITNLFKYYGY